MNDTTVHANPRNRRLKILAFAAAIAATVLALGALGARHLSPAPVATPEKLSIAALETPYTALLRIAEAKGFFAEEKLDVTIVPAIHGPAAIGVVVEGEADLAAVAEVPFVIAVMKGNDLGMISSLFSASSAHAIVARRDRGIAAPRDLVGKKVGATLRASGEYYLWAFLVRHKLALDSVTLVDVPPDRIVQELAKGTVDAIATWEPNVLGAQVAMGDKVASFTETGAYTMNLAIVGRSDFLKGHRTAIEKLLRALLKAEQFNRERPQDALSLVAARLKIDDKALQPEWSGFNFKVDLLQSHLVTLEDQARWAMARGYVETRPVPNFLPNLYLDALLAVRSERVTVVR